MELDRKLVLVKDDPTLKDYIITERLRLVCISKNGRKHRKGKNLYNRQLSRMRRLLL